MFLIAQLKTLTASLLKVEMFQGEKNQTPGICMLSPGGARIWACNLLVLCRFIPARLGE